MNGDTWQEIRGLMRMQKDVQLGGPKIRARAIDYRMCKKRFQRLIDVGAVYPSEALSGCERPDEWIAWHCGWLGTIDDFGAS